MSLSPRRVCHIVFKRWKLFLAVLCAPLLGYCLLVLNKRPQFESTAAILVKVGESDAVMPDRLSERQARGADVSANMAKQIINSEQLIIVSPDVLKSTLDRVGVEVVYPGLSERAARDGAPVLDFAAERLARDVTTNVNNNTNVIALSLFNADAEVARSTLAALLVATVDKDTAITRDPRLKFLEAKLETLKQSADAAMRRLLEFKKETRITAFDEERTLLLRQRDATEMDSNQTESNLVAAEGRARALASSLENTPKQITLSDENDRMQRQLDDARLLLTAAQARYETARRHLTPNNPELAEHAMQLKIARESFENLEASPMARVRTGANPVSHQLSGDLSVARSEADANRAATDKRGRQLQHIDERLAYLDDHETALRELELQREVADRDYRSYLERVQSARILADMNQAGITNLSVLQPPTLPYQPARPRKLLLLALALFAGLAGALSLCVLRELADDRMSMPEQVEALVGVPVIAVVNLRRLE